MSSWDWLVRVGGGLAVLLALLRIRDHFFNRARLRVKVARAKFIPKYFSPDKPWRREAARPVGVQNFESRTSVEIDLEIRNTGRASTTLSAVSLQSKHPLLGNREMLARAGDLLLVQMKTMRIEPNGILQLTVHAIFDDAPDDESISGKLQLTFTEQKKSCRLILERQ